jgi:alkylmercury lyase-like protein
MSEHLPIDGRVHHALVAGIIATGAAPSNQRLAADLRVPVPGIEDSLRRLEENHALVLHPQSCRPAIVHPFSLTPTAVWLEKGEQGWWSPCMWCALGAAVLVGGTVKIHARLGGERQDLDLEVRDGKPARRDLLIHIAVPPRDAWVDVRHFCATLLPFDREADIDAWSKRHALPRGAALPVETVAELARRWYGKHADKDWRKWTAAEAKQVFQDCGLVGEFWALEVTTGRF